MVPSTDTHSDRAITRELVRWWLSVLLFVVLSQIGLILLGLARFNSVDALLGYAQGYPLVSNHEPVQLGCIVPGTPAIASVELTNLTDHPVTILGIDTCGPATWLCTDLPLRVQPHESVRLIIQVCTSRRFHEPALSQSAFLFLDKAGPRPYVSIVGTITPIPSSSERMDRATEVNPRH
jgi:hypothetical protein